MSIQWEVFYKIKPWIEYGRSLLSFNITTGSLKQRICIILTHFLSIVLCLLCANFVINSFRGGITTTLILSITVWIALFEIPLKVFLGYRHRGGLLQLYALIENFHEETIEDHELRKIVSKTINEFDKRWFICFKTHQFLFLSSVTCYTILSFITGKDGLLIEVPFLPKDTSNYMEIMLLVQYQFLLVGSFDTVFCDSIIAFIGLEIMATLDIVYKYIISNKDEIQKDPNFLVTVVERYCKSVQFINVFSDTFSNVIFVKFVVSILLNLIVFFCIRQNTEDVSSYYMQICAIFQLLIPCLFCELIVMKTERIPVDLYQTNWYELDLKDQKAFVLVLGMTQRDHRIRAAGMYDVNIYTFLQIMKLAITYCALLYTFNAK